MSGDEHQGQDASETARKVKRKRIALACSGCRKRKLKCDLEFPACGRCQQSRHPEACTYDHEAVEEVSSRQSPSRHLAFSTTGTAKNIGEVYHPPTKIDENLVSDLRGRIQHLENRITGLERLISRSQLEAPNSTFPFKPISGDGNLPTHEEEPMLYRGRDFKTMFYGATHPAACLSQIPTLRAFMKDMAIQHPKASRIRKDLKSLKVKPVKICKHTSDDFLPDVLPSKELVDYYVKLYVGSFETSYRVLHLPSFWTSYTNLWRGPSKTKPGFVCLVLLMMAATYCLSSHDSEKSSRTPCLARDKARYWIEECEIWLSCQSEKRMTTETVQSKCVLLIAQQMQSSKRKRTFTDVETLMSFAISKGLHRDADIVNRRGGERKVSIFDQEMRRRLWSTVAELELEGALDRGMPSSFPDLKVDCGAPYNCMDEALYPEMEHTPIAQPDSEITPSSYQSMASKSHSLRKQITCLLNGSDSRLSYVEVLALDEKVLQCLNGIPMWVQSDSLLPRALLQLQLYQLLLLLHRNFLSSQEGQHTYSRSTSVRAARAIIDLLHDKMTNGCRVLLIFRQDLRNAALSICYDFVKSQELADRALMPCFFSSSEANHASLLGKAEVLARSKVDVSGAGLKDYYFVAACLGLVSKSKNSDRNEEYIAAHKVVEVMEQMCAQLNTTDLPESSTMTNGSASVPQTHRVQLKNTTMSNSESGNAGAIVEDTACFLDSQFDLSDWDWDSFFST